MFKFRGTQLHRKEIYPTLSLILCIVLFSVLVNDFVATKRLETPENTSYGITFLILFMHCVAFCMGALGCVYNGLSDQLVGFYISIASTGLNLAMFMIRIIYEAVFLEFRPEELAHSA
ncbi:uncharacterized protein LOC116618001 [Nematostella vectensis]|uniref:uncharacterized protein LOC116618001 n=1 Tax=Nematostella vectensis TaxID=45351 RepID=UPI00138FBAC1|nr:uncharacterized protein LOC116618001 [Nematostella vectensis]